MGGSAYRWGVAARMTLLEFASLDMAVTHMHAGMQLVLYGCVLSSRGLY